MSHPLDNNATMYEIIQGVIPFIIICIK
jgi:hypothetical protein